MTENKTFKFVPKHEEDETPFLLELTAAQLEKYPDCILTVMTVSHWRKNEENVIYVDMSSTVLQTLQHFFDKGYWPNPYHYENRLMLYIPEVGENFIAACDYLGLDSEPFDESYEDEVNFETDGEEQEDDFEPFDPSDSEDDEFDPFRESYCGDPECFRCFVGVPH